MRLALLGTDETVMELARAITLRHQSRQSSAPANGRTIHQIVCAYGSGKFAEELRTLGIDQHPAEAWEELILDPKCEAVIVGSGSPESVLPDQLRKLIQAETPLVVSHPIADMLQGFELQMIRRDTGSTILPYFPGCDHPIWDTIKRWVDDGANSPIGVVEQFEWERSLVDRSRRSVEASFARDALLQRRMVGPIQRLGAMLSGNIPANKTNDWSQLSAHMDNADGVLARWAVRPANAGTSSLRIIGSKGAASVELGPDPHNWRLTLVANSQAVDVPEWSGSASVIDRLASESGVGLIRSDEPRLGRSSDEPPIVEPSGHPFNEACRAVELADTLVTSCRRGRTIDLHQEELTEEGTFKSMMAAGGCFALVLTLMVTLLMVATSPFGPSSANGDAVVGSPAGAHWLWKLLLVGLLIFLALQFLRLLFPQPSSSESATPTAPDAST